MIKKILIITGLSTILLSSAMQVSYALQIDPSYRPENAPFSLEENTNVMNSDGSNEGARDSTVILLNIIAGTLLYFAAPIAVIIIGLGAFNMVVGGADTEKLEQSKKHLTWAVLGLLTIILSYSIVRIVVTLVITTAEKTAT